MRQRRRALAFFLVGPAVLWACTASLELDRFRHQPRNTEGGTSGTVGPNGNEDGGGDSSSGGTNKRFFDLKMSFIEMTPHISEYFEVRIIDNNNNSVVAKAVYPRVSNPDFTLTMKDVLPKSNSRYRIDFWADKNKSGNFDWKDDAGVNDRDHSWRRLLYEPFPFDVTFESDAYNLEFLHDTIFSNIFEDLEGKPFDATDVLLPFDVTIAGIGGRVAGKMMEVRIVHKATQRLVGLHRTAAAAVPSYAAQVKGILDEGTTYELLIYGDANDDGKYDPSDPSWKGEITSTSAGITQEVDLGTLTSTPIETGQ